MYQFTENLKGIMPPPKKKTYRWRGLSLGIALGWLPAWGLSYFLQCGFWAGVGIWILTWPLGYGLGKMIPKGSYPQPRSA